MITRLVLERSSPFKEDLASAANSWMPADFRESAGDFPDFGIISISSNFTCKTKLLVFRKKNSICAPHSELVCHFSIPTLVYIVQLLLQMTPNLAHRPSSRNKTSWFSYLFLSSCLHSFSTPGPQLHRGRAEMVSRHSAQTTKSHSLRSLV